MNEPSKTSNIVAIVQARSRYSRVSPIRGLDATRLANMLDAFSGGYLSEASRLWDVMERRDDMIASVKNKRVGAVSRLDWEVLTTDDSAQAKEQADKLTYFYNQLEATRADDLNVRGGLSRLIAQMMDAVGKKYAVHEIVWKPSLKGLSAQFRYVPLWFFENTTGRLRFVADGGVSGIELAENEWLTHTGDGIMEASSVAYFFKHLPLNDWLTYCERNGMPGIAARTPAAPNSPEWNACADTITAFGAEYIGLFSSGTEITAIDLTSKGTLPYPILIERMDRAIAILWRGADLSTMSKGDSVGASTQADESALIESDDALAIEETLHEQATKPALRYLFGDGVEPLAYLKLKTRDTKRASEIAELKALSEIGVPLSLTAIRERFALPTPTDAEDTLGIVSTSAPTVPAANAEEIDAGIDDYVDESALALTQAMRADFGTLAQSLLEAAESATSEEDLKARLKVIQAMLPDALKTLAESSVTKAYEAITAGAFFNGLTTQS